MAGLILCGGSSVRMGRDKPLLTFDGVRLLDRVHERLAAAADPILFASGTPGRLGPLPGPEVPDPSPDAGPLGAIVAGLEASPHEVLAVVAVDMPHVHAGLLRLLAGLSDSYDAVVPVDTYGPQVLHAVYARRSLGRMKDAFASGARGPSELLDVLDVRLVGPEEWRVADPTGRFAVNLNRPEDLEGLGGPARDL